ncbi:acetyl-CoA carboxylase biotin carboxyl carrier protein [Asticcacaulis sp. BYS171W]|uniref:Biotin carboxyl carrier protein of acetyl-CoA carboxylase n=1 Tax=Asticcacaulis aquaticus TaxID=2984212 RepID=A0ABT5HNP9_9CAUL|nr:acetyl-CoA carboxylase biotin carboxyl carrier protein [Asticcacaulis aquaticus]MDC7681691.1 acetyl-CoA carboxylase biotin carboxyl carrier protein [Asticcacaulis aquaticus]
MSSQKPVDPIDPRLVRKLADILKETELTEIEVEQGDLKIRVARQLTAAPAVAYAAAPAPVAVAPAPAPVAPAAAPAAEAPKAAAKDAVASPMVGTVYLAPQPGAANFIKVGDKVKAGQTLLIIEAMKTMNPIPSPKDGTVSEVLVADGKPVEFGEGLVVID